MGPDAGLGGQVLAWGPDAGLGGQVLAWGPDAGLGGRVLAWGPDAGFGGRVFARVRARAWVPAADQGVRPIGQHTMMYSVTIRCPLHEKDSVIAELWDSRTEGVVENDIPGGAVELRAFFDDRATAQEFARRFATQVEEEQERDWVSEMRESWEPFPVGRRFWLAPSWRTEPPPEGRERIEIDPGRAFGTGTHETTQLCLEAIENLVRPGMSVLDLGTGTGVLALGAFLLGAAPVVACDIDADAATVARENFSKAGTAIAVFAGSGRSVRSRSIDLLIANINTATLSNLAEDLVRILRPGGRAILSGFPLSDADALETLLAGHGLKRESGSGKGPWGCLVVSG